MNNASGIVAEAEGEVRARGRGEGGSQCRGGERSETPRNGETPSPRQMNCSEKPPESFGASSAAQDSGAQESGVCDSTRSPLPTHASAQPDLPGVRLCAPQRSDPEVLEKPVRRKFTAEYKRRILEEADACREQGQLGALMRREGLYASYLSNWRRERNAAVRKGLSPRKRGRKPTKNPLTDEVKRLARENIRIRRELEQAKLIIDIQKKTSQLLGITLTDVSEHEKILYGEGDD